MKKQKFKIGDRVRYIHTIKTLCGKSGTIVAINRDVFGVKFDECAFILHTLEGRCEESRGWWCKEEEIEYLNAQRIVIEEEGRETIATLYVDNKPSKTAKAKCNPEDKQDFKIGAYLAFDRLFEKPKRDTDFKLGDIVRFRTWEDMEEEFGSDAHGDIQCKPAFTSKMSPLCGMVFVVERAHSDGSVALFNHPRSVNCKWLISTDMLEKFDLSEFSK